MREVDVDPAAERLAGVLKDPQGLPFTIGFVDGVMRPESLAAAASNLNRVAPLVPKFLPWYLRGAVQVGGAVAPVLPSPVVPIARRVLREMVGHLVVDARPDKLGPAIAKIRENGAKLNLNLLGEAVLGEQEALRRLDGIHELIRRPDVDYVSVKVSAIASHISMWAFDEVVDKVVERLMPLYLTAAIRRDVHQPRHGGVPRPRPHDRGVHPHPRRPPAAAARGRHRAAGVPARRPSGARAADRVGASARRRRAVRASRCGS